jgi:hypothetical protein
MVYQVYTKYVILLFYSWLLTSGGCMTINADEELSPSVQQNPPDSSKAIPVIRCLDQYLSMAFAQLTYRESLRDIEACLRAHQSKLYHMGIRSRVVRSTLGRSPRAV